MVYSPEVPQEAKAGPVEEAQNDESDAKINEYKERLRRQKEEFQAKKAKEEAERMQKQEEENRRRKEAEELEEKRKEQLKQEKIQEMNNQIEVSIMNCMTHLIPYGSYSLCASLPVETIMLFKVRYYGILILMSTGSLITSISFHFSVRRVFYDQATL